MCAQRGDSGSGTRRINVLERWRGREGEREGGRERGEGRERERKGGGKTKGKKAQIMQYAPVPNKHSNCFIIVVYYIHVPSLATPAHIHIRSMQMYMHNSTTALGLHVYIHVFKYCSQQLHACTCT